MSPARCYDLAECAPDRDDVAHALATHRATSPFLGRAVDRLCAPVPGGQARAVSRFAADRTSACARWHGWRADEIAGDVDGAVRLLQPG
jgi:hypothetical protein